MGQRLRFFENRMLRKIFGAERDEVNRDRRGLYRVSQEEWTKFQEGVPYVKLYRYNPKHLYPKLNGYGDNGQRKVWTSCISTYCTSTAV